MSPFETLIGHQTSIELLKQAVAKDRIAPAYLFVGSPGIGRRLAALGFSELLLRHNIPPDKHPLIHQKLTAQNHPDFLWVQPTYQHQNQLLTAQEAAESGLKRKAPPKIRIEQIRDIGQFLSRPPLEATRAVVVIEDAHTMAEGAANALLKTLEEPGRATIILISPSADALLPTLVSRCQRIPFYRLAEAELQQVLDNLGREEIKQDETLLAIAQGSPGAAILAQEHLQTIPQDLLNQLLTPPKTALAALQLAKELDKTLDTEVQLWLIDYLQYRYWHNQQRGQLEGGFVRQLEQAKKNLLAYAQPRLVWECTLLSLIPRSRDRV
ncbi:DNA polymerase III subunit delta' [Spirulina sp. CS-785/01]|uniref:DNA polymerase III subunit delta' n=1 Tax=Spirulina sp. CS-785/01 TaxID=3021716 RepID=UPI00232F80B4|nr:DNA polymerase III subunit delta' [Spirulina sp. CS-785/01]MDB9312441.1 DNA polymerase III subunit delta' [Spirulina sp. CS-785/01]